MLGDPDELAAAEAVECGLLNMTTGARSGVTRVTHVTRDEFSVRCEVSMVNSSVSILVELRNLERRGSAKEGWPW